MPIEAVNESLNGRFVDMADIGGRLTSFATGNHGLGLDEPEGIDDNFALDRLDGVNNHGYRAWVERLKGLRRSLYCENTEGRDAKLIIPAGC